MLKITTFFRKALQNENAYNVFQMDWNRLVDDFHLLGMFKIISRFLKNPSDF